MDFFGLLSVLFITWAAYSGVVALAAAVRAHRLDGNRFIHGAVSVAHLTMAFVLAWLAGWLGSRSIAGDFWHAYLNFLHLWHNFPFPK